MKHGGSTKARDQSKVTESPRSLHSNLLTFPLKCVLNSDQIGQIPVPYLSYICILIHSTIKNRKMADISNVLLIESKHETSDLKASRNVTEM